ncbi:Coenzyme F420 hydrogenase/dehydrogenase, beta subunit C-terminal domain [Scatolibacter rhodanostii]|uniref:Coenzyme F420 hydrogenase/dehydrogenase, beta subunit C-terminal domain n=1 Tax=Scatolibacter rhodanostii TaxID=2014781 RepID=UPI000C078500|nr:Coenzyme F420 hydrogenase/dehydrogenase, beta subunit C-terminal domain [Scatolibacter rhodanostii]
MLNIKDSSECCGCFACKSICPVQCISMESDYEGFWYPLIKKEHCINCNLCEAVCPIMHTPTAYKNLAALAAYNQDAKIRAQSSSGGVFTALAENVLSSGGIVFGAVFNRKFEVEHTYIKKKEDLRVFRGSKYVHSKIGFSYIEAKEFLDKGKLVYFSGTPCQIAGLRSYLRKDYDNLICQDVICHGVPSPKVWIKYVNYREIKARAKIKGITFRDKEDSWKKYSVKYEYEGRDPYKKVFYRDPMMQLFLKNICLRPSCYHCSFKSSQRYGDITLADYWGIEKKHPEMFDDKGCSLVLINSQKGQDLYDKIKKSINSRDTDLNYAIRCNPSATQSSIENVNRTTFFSQIDKVAFNKIINRYAKEKIQKRLKNKLLSLILGKKIGGNNLEEEK